MNFEIYWNWKLFSSKLIDKQDIGEYEFRCQFLTEKNGKLTEKKGPDRENWDLTEKIGIDREKWD